MVDTALRPRPGFSSFLRSDAGDALSYYQYQRLLRSQKVALLQEKAAKAYVPGYKKPAPLPTHTSPVSRKIFQLPSRSPLQHAQTDIAGQRVTFPVQDVHRKATEGEQWAHVEKRLQPLHGTAEPHVGITTSEASAKEHVHVQVERVPRIFTRERLVKSATTRDRTHTWPTQVPAQPQRPKTVGGIRNVRTITIASQHDLVAPEAKQRQEPKEAQTAAHRHTASEQCVPLEQARRSSPTPCHTHQRAHTYAEGTQVQDVEENTAAPPKLPAIPDKSAAEREALAKAFFWSTSTQKAYDEVGWAERMPTPIPPPPSTLEHLPDPVSQKLIFRRYHSAPAGWQSFGREWDFVQTRVGSFAKGLQAVDFCTRNRYNQHIPGYMGYVQGSDELDNPHCEFNPTLLVRTLKPRPTKISRHANIPGYSSHVHWTRIQPAHSDLPLPHLTTSTRVHRPLPLEEEPSPFQRTGVLSKTVTLVSPYNPFNKIEH